MYRWIKKSFWLILITINLIIIDNYIKIQHQFMGQLTVKQINNDDPLNSCQITVYSFTEKIIIAKLATVKWKTITIKKNNKWSLKAPIKLNMEYDKCPIPIQSNIQTVVIKYQPKTMWIYLYWQIKKNLN